MPATYITVFNALDYPLLLDTAGHVIGGEGFGTADPTETSVARELTRGVLEEIIDPGGDLADMPSAMRLAIEATRAANNAGPPPAAAPNPIALRAFAGEWQADTVYIQGVVVSSEGDLYISETTHTSASSFTADGTHWRALTNLGGSFLSITEAPPVPHQYRQAGDTDWTAAFQRMFAADITAASVPPSTTPYDVSETLAMPITMSLDVDLGATIRAATALNGPLLTIGQANNANRWSFKHLLGGTWDCNDNAAGIVVYAYRSSILGGSLTVLDSTGNFITVGDVNNPANGNGLRVQDCFTDRDPNSNVPVGSFGIQILGADCHMIHTTVVGAETSFRNDGTGNRFLDCHGWGWANHLPIVIFDSNGFDVDFMACKADSPSLYGWFMRKVGWRVTGGEVLNGPAAIDGVIGIHVDPSRTGNPQGNILGTQFVGSLTHFLAQDYDGQVPAGTLSAVGCISFQVTNPVLGTQDMLRGRNGAQTHVQTVNTLPTAIHAWTFKIPDVDIPTFYAGRIYNLDLIARDGTNNARATASCQILVYQDSLAGGVKITLCKVDNKLGTAFADGLANGTYGVALAIDTTGLSLTVDIQNNSADNAQFGMKLT